LTYIIIYDIDIAIKASKENIMKIEIDDKLINDYKNNITLLSKTDSEIVEYLLKQELIKGGFDGYETDYLSGLLTLPRLERDIQNIINKRPFGFYKTILYFNINNMKRYNDINGFSKGDELIKYFSNKLIELYDDKKYRIGGQEFIIPSFDNIDLKNTLTFDNVNLYQYKIVIKLKKKTDYPLAEDYLKLILEKINSIRRIKIEKLYKLKI
jgi:GGDEF domain-containing protein